MTELVTSDLHLDDKPTNADRWNIFSWLKDQAIKHGVHDIILLGDVTDAKDRHSAILVNRLVDELNKLSRYCGIFWVMGNHDRLDENTPFFRFLDRGPRGADYKEIRYINKPYECALKGNRRATFLPNVRNYKEEWQSLSHLSDLIGGNINVCNYIFCHQTFDGCIVENGTRLGGIPPSFFKGYKGQVISGDIHVPQEISSNILYVGAPYRVHFGDAYEPRVLLLSPNGMKDLSFPGKPRLLLVADGLKQLEESKAEMGSQVKIRISLKRADLPEWPALRKKIKELAASRGWELHGLEPIASQDRVQKAVTAEKPQGSPEDEVATYAASRKLEKRFKEAGLEFLKAAQQ